MRQTAVFSKLIEETEHGYHSINAPEPPDSLEQGQTHRTEATAKAAGSLGDSDPAPDGRKDPRAGPFNLVIDSKLRSCDLLRLRVLDVAHVLSRASVTQQKTKQSVRFEVSEQTRDSIATWVKEAGLKSTEFLLPSRFRGSPHLSTRRYSSIVKTWIRMIGADPQEYGTHSLRRTEATLIYRRTKNRRAVQLLPSHRKPESTVPYLGIEVDDALDMAERIEC